MWHTPSSDLGTHIWMKLIELVRQHPMIYLSTKKRSSELRRNRNELNQIWEDISAKIGFTVEDTKRRWKSLKDVYSKIRKRRVQEDVLGIKARKKWLYEDAMSFVKFPFEQMYHKALENLQVDCDDWKLQDVESNDTEEEHLNDRNDNLESINIESKEHSITEDQNENGTEEYLDLYFEADTVPELDKNNAPPTQSSGKDNCANDTSRVEAFLSKEKRSRNPKTKTQYRYREIRPKPHQPNLLSKSKTIRSRNAIKYNKKSTTSLVNVSGLKPLSGSIVSQSALQWGEDCNTVILPSSNIKEEGCLKTGNIDAAVTPSIVPDNALKNSKDRGMDSPVSQNKYSTLLHSPYKKSAGGSVELFFESMAQTVKNLPTRVQAEIKMEICRLVTRAEIQYSNSHLSPKLESRKFRSEKG